MKKSFAFLLLALLTFTTQAQLDCSRQLDCRIIAKSGMRLRATPSLKAKVVTSVPYDSMVVACQETFGEMTYEEMTGYWRKVEFHGKSGFMFDGFLEIIAVRNPTWNAEPDTNVVEEPKEEEKPLATTTKSSKYSLMTETYNYCGDANKIDAGLIWYGFYPPDASKGQNYVSVKEVEVNVVLSKTKVGKGLEFDVETNDENRSIFLIGLNRKLEAEGMHIKDNSEQLRYGGRKVFPGQELVLGQNEKPIKLSATGNVESSGPCPELTNYKLSLKGEKYFLPVEQNITEELVHNGQCGMPEIYWYGDFTGDGVPEIIFVSVYKEKNHFTLFISDPHQDNVLVRKEAEWVIDKCY
ncbi:SH3 domain-containing protein [Owenweeksia hongkongensis]|uniref:SH3 domain-containing protein n=1 Tax=Owenweeksia hongkongensis TaxID=253245 RepID=UPI003A9570DB